MILFFGKEVIALHNLNKNALCRIENGFGIDMQIFMLHLQFKSLSCWSMLVFIIFEQHFAINTNTDFTPLTSKSDLGTYTCNDVQFNKVQLSQLCYIVDPLSFVHSLPF